MVNIKMELWHCVMTFSVVIMISEASYLHFEPGLRNLQSASIEFTSYEYDPTKKLISHRQSSIHTNKMRFRRVLRTINRSSVTNSLENVFRNIFENTFENGENNTCYFGEVFQKNEQYYEFKIKPRASPFISIGFGYAWNNVKLKGRTAEFVVNSTSKVLLSKNDNAGNIEVAIQSGNATEVLRSPKNRLYRPVVCLKGSASITVTVYNGMKMATDVSPMTDVVDLPKAGKKLKSLTYFQIQNTFKATVSINLPNNLLGVGLIQPHTLTSTTPNTYLLIGYFFDCRNWWMSPNLLDKLNNWGTDKIYSGIDVSTTSITLSVWLRGDEAYSMTVLINDRNWDSRIFIIYDTSGDSPQVPVGIISSRDDVPTVISKPNCSGVDTCSEGNECNWPRSDRQNLLPGVCITKNCKYMIEAHKRTGLYKRDGVRFIGGETAMRLIRPSDVGVKRKGIAMIKALLDRADDFGDINPTGEYEFGGPISPPNSVSDSQKRYFNDVDIYLDVDKSVCDEEEKFIPIKSSAGITVGFGKYLIFFDYIRCVSHYAVIENLVTNALDPKKYNVLQEYARSQFQRVDPNSALDEYESQNSDQAQLSDSPESAPSLPKDVTDKLYYNDPDLVAGFSDLPHLQAFYNHDYFSAETVLYLGLSSCFGDCVKNYYANGSPVFHITTFVRERATDDNSIDKKYYTEVHPLMWYSGLNYYGIDFEIRDLKTFKRDVKMTLYDEYNIPSWFVNKNGADPDMVEASYISLPALLTRGDYPPNLYLTDDTAAEQVGLRLKSPFFIRKSTTTP